MHAARWACSVVALLWALGTAGAQELGITTASDTGTYIKIGRDISELVGTKGIGLTVAPSRGSFENVVRVRHMQEYQLGIVQSDVLEFIKEIGRKDPTKYPALADIPTTLKLVLPLYNEEIHVLAQGDIVELGDLAGKVVGIGRPGSGTFLTSVVLLKLAGIKPARTEAIGGEDAVKAMRNQRLDAMIDVAGYPSSLFQNFVTEADGFELVPIENPKIKDFYPSAVIPAGVYAWHPRPYQTVAVKAALVSYDYKGERCGQIGQIASLVREGIGSLRAKTPKWNQVDLDATLPGWERLSCVDVTPAGGAAPAAPKGRDVRSLLRK